VNPQSVGTASPAAGSVPHIYTKGATAYYSRAGWSVCGGGVGRPAVVPPAGRGGGVGRAPAGALGEGRWGAFFESAEEGAAGSEIQPYLGGAGVGCGRLGDPALPGGRRCWVRPARRSSPTWGAPVLGAAGSQIQPYLGGAGVGCGRLGDPALPGGRRCWVRAARRSEPYLGCPWVRARQCRGCQHGSPRRFDEGVDAAVCPRQFQKS
jgi:hypothetical protein